MKLIPIMETIVKKSSRFVVLAAVLLAALAVSAYGVALAAPGLNLMSSSLGGLFNGGRPDSSAVTSAGTAGPAGGNPDVAETEVADVTETEAPDIETETPEATEAPDAQEDGQAENSDEATGVVSALDATTITVDGVVYTLTDSTEINGTIQAGDTVKLEFVTNADGSLTLSEVKISSEGQQINDSGGGSGQDGGSGDGSNGGSDDDGGGDSGDD
jgi:uncharacterized membrane protein YgcG